MLIDAKAVIKGRERPRLSNVTSAEGLDADGRPLGWGLDRGFGVISLVAKAVRESMPAPELGWGRGSDSSFSLSSSPSASSSNERDRRRLRFR